ncbi:hypothetical protein [Arthrobacter sp. A5]|uniref:hypothetical protein n=1 Tax=Arthrobacter sp. A5 TaxID=576926 RepID=UPI003DA83EC8
MSVPSKAFQQWLHSVAPATSTAAVSRLSGIKRSTLAQQLVRGKVALVTVVSISRAFDVDVVGALSSFDKYRDLVSGFKPPTEAELISQVSDLDLLQQIIARNAAGDIHEQGPARGLAPMPHKSSVRGWIEAIDTADLRQRISHDLRMAPQNLSAQLSANRLPPDVAIQAARIAGVGVTGGLVVTGLLTPEEVGWPRDARETALRALPDAELVILAAARLDALGKTLRRADQDHEHTKALWENLG